MHVPSAASLLRRADRLERLALFTRGGKRRKGPPSATRIRGARAARRLAAVVSAKS